jgi:MFS family permease
MNALRAKPAKECGATMTKWFHLPELQLASTSRIRAVISSRPPASAVCSRSCAILLSIGTSVARELIDSSNALVNGAALAVFAVASGVVPLAARPLPARINIVAGGIASTVGMGFLMFAASTHSLAVFLLALATAGAAYSFSVLGGLTLINAHVPSHQRGAPHSRRST